MNKRFTILTCFILALFAVFASADCVTVQSKHTATFVEEIPNINSQLSSCQPALPTGLSTLYKNADMQVVIQGDDKTHEFAISIANGKLTSIAAGKALAPQYTITTSEADFDSMLQADDLGATFAHLYKNKRITINANTLWSRLKFWVTSPFLNWGMGKIQVAPTLQPPQTADNIGMYPDKRVCDFYQTNKKLVTCAGYKAADTFCVLTFGHPEAKSEKCEENGIVVCSLPCNPNQYAVVPKTCAFDNARPRGSQAAPLDFCNPQAAAAQPVKKEPGAICQHGGECRTGNCVGEGQGPPWTYKCSCNAFKYVGSGC